ncbi:hypothetical protein PRIPAC_91794 [Pristionchus pacificus]|uniref:Uncharacterized protein n=1 Tax=Pristionchus pacificus TaxID=54126 RepID=A0A2A6CE50_PRIPA|nr:hypothetical protein PRIPAC_91794 [Pristionchus pacificus]|eukprot:PDM76389.1 hypothetical protein PRIPAC_39993 [Pristionchus pacificus]
MTTKLLDASERLVENIRPDGILLNELRLKADSVQNFQNKFKNQISDLGYAIMRVSLDTRLGYSYPQELPRTMKVPLSLRNAHHPSLLPHAQLVFSKRSWSAAT